MKNKAFFDNFKNELVYKCTSGKYIPKNAKNLNEITLTKRINRATSFYTFSTFETFAKSLKQMSDDDIRNEYSNYFLLYLNLV